MSLLLETIRYANGTFDNLSFHQQRMDRSSKELFGNKIPPLLLQQLLYDFLSEQNPGKDIVYKCRLVYGKQVKKMELIPYFLPKIKSLTLVQSDSIDYHLKYLNRNLINELFQQRGDCDDILIVKNRLITDTSFANILFFNGKEWLTPSLPLLKGTRREQLLQAEVIHTADIRPADLPRFEKARIINAMIRFEDRVEIVIENGVF